MGFTAACYFVTAEGQRVDLATANDLFEAIAVWEDQDWQREVAKAEKVTGQFPCLWWVRTGEPTTTLSVSGEGEGRFLVMLQVVARPGVLGLFGREAASPAVDGASADQVRTFLAQFYALDKHALCAWAKTVSSP